MTKKMIPAPAKAPEAEDATASASAPRVTRSQTLIDLMRTESGATAAELAAAVGWQVHSVRGFIAGTLKKRPDLTVLTERKDNATHYRVVDRVEAQG